VNLALAAILLVSKIDYFHISNIVFSKLQHTWVCVGFGVGITIGLQFFDEFPPDGFGAGAGFPALSALIVFFKLAIIWSFSANAAFPGLLKYQYMEKSC